MTLTGDPAHAFVVIVGVEESRLFDDDPLVGPVRDAVEWCDWFVARGVPQDRIRLFVAPKQSSQELLDGLQERHGKVSIRMPTEAAFREFMVAELPGLASDEGDSTLFVLWSGHGLIDQRDTARTRRLFYAESTSQIAVNLEIVSFMKALRTPRYAGFAQQLLVVDACANYSVGFARGNRMLAPTDFSATGHSDGIEQRVMLSTAPGQVAATDAGAHARESVTLFSSRLRKQLGRTPAATAQPWPDFEAAFMAVRAQFREADQTPVDWCVGMPDDTLPDGGAVVLPDVSATRLVAALAGIDNELLKKAWRAAIKPADPTPDHHAAVLGGLADMAWLLGQAVQRTGELSALSRWAVEVRIAMSDAAAARDHPELLQWIKWHPDRAAMHRVVETRRAEPAKAQDSLCFLLVKEEDGPSADEPRVLQGWLFASDRPSRVLTDAGMRLVVQADGRGRASGLKALLDLANDSAMEMGIDLPQIVVEYALPIAHIDLDVERHNVGANEHAERPIGTRNLVVRRLADRVSALSRPNRRGTEITQWTLTARDLKQRFEAHGLQIVWIEPERIREGLLQSYLHDKPNSSCIGLTRLAPGRQLDERLKYSLYDDALPFACWTDDAWSADDLSAFETEMSKCRGNDALTELFRVRSIHGFQKHAAARLHILWDDPSHNPYEHQLKARST